jgi:hypothetical protein
MLGALRTKLETALAKIGRKTSLAQAICYALTNWRALTRYTTDGRLEISNNAAERAIRPLALGRKNWLFAGSHGGGVAAATIYTIIQTAHLNGLDPEAIFGILLPGSRITRQSASAICCPGTGALGHNPPNSHYQHQNSCNTAPLLYRRSSADAYPCEWRKLFVPLLLQRFV